MAEGIIKKEKSFLESILPRIKKNVLLADFTTFKIGGPATYFFIAKTNKDLADALLFANKYRLPFFILGKGSNILIPDKGIRGLVIRLQTEAVFLVGKKIICESGVSMSSLVQTALDNNLAGTEWAAGIPGTVGGAVRGNAGAFGMSMSDIVESVEALEIQNNGRKIIVKKFLNSDCRFDYRSSLFCKKSNLIILSCRLSLARGDSDEIKRKINAYLNYRKNRHPLDFPSAGSVFRNYESKILNKKIIKEFPEIETFNKNKLIPAAFLIEECGLKGKKIGGVKISEQHANFILNVENGKAKDVTRLIALVKQKVKKKFGVILKEEIIIFRAI